MRVTWFLGLLVACTAKVVPAPPQAITVAPPKETFEPRPRPEQATSPTLERYEPRDVVNPTLRRTQDRVILAQGGIRWQGEQRFDVADIDFLNRCVREFVQAQPDTARRVLVDAFTHYVTTCGADRTVVLERPVGFDSRDRKSRSDLSLVGTLAVRGTSVVLRVASCGTEQSYDRVTLVAGGESWTSSRLEVRRDVNGCEVAEVPFTRVLAKMLRLAIENKAEGAAMLRFDGAGVELEISDGIRDELRSVLAAIEALTVL